MGMDMLQARLGKLKMKESEIKTYVDDISITP
jgi:multiple antibiotic resistance protein